jgi:hypothetical protein
MTDDIFKGHGVEILLDNEEAFLKIRETLSRIGVASRKERTLYPSCYILHKRGFYRIVHFKELFALDGRPTDISENDLARRNSISLLLQDWELLKISNENAIKNNTVDLSQIKILTHKEKSDWEIHHKYSIGSKKNNNI